MGFVIDVKMKSLTDYIVLQQDTKNGLTRPGNLVQDLSFVWKKKEFMKEDILVPVPVTLMREAPFGTGEGVIVSATDLGVDVNKAGLLLQEPVSIQAKTAAPVRLVPALDEKRTKAFTGGTATVCLENKGAYWDLVGEEEGDGYYDHLTRLQPLCRIPMARDPDGAVVLKYSGLACANSSGQPLLMLEYSDLNSEAADLLRDSSGGKETGNVLSILCADMFANRKDFRNFRVQHGSEDWPQPDFRLAVYNTLNLSESKPVLLRADQKICSNDFETEIDLSTRESGEMLCVARQSIILPEQNNETWYEERQSSVLENCAMSVLMNWRAH